MTTENVQEREPSPEPKDKSLMLFGRDVSKIPCFRNSILYGMYAGFGSGLGHFLLKSRPRAACDFAVYTFSAVTLVWWFQCRYKYSQTKFEMLKMQELLRRNAMYEGTGLEKEIDEKTSSSGT